MIKALVLTFPFIFLAYLMGGAMADIGETLRSESYIFTMWMAIKLIAILTVIMWVGWESGRSYQNHLNNK